MYKFLLPLFALALLVGCTPSNNTDTDTYGYGSAASVDAMEPASSASTTVSSSPTDMPSDVTLLSGKHTVVLKTSKGNITLELDADAAPKTVTNFITLSERGYYNNLTFHRVIPEFMIQGGDPDGNGTGGESIFGAEFEDEPNNLQMTQGVIAMANRGPNTNGSQFFIVTSPEGTPWLQGRHTIFGKVTAGLDIALAIEGVDRSANDRPVTPVTFTPQVKN